MCRIDLQIMPNARADRVRCYVVVASYSFYLTLALAAASLYHNNVWEKFKKKWRIRSVYLVRIQSEEVPPANYIVEPKKKQNKSHPNKQTSTGSATSERACVPSPNSSKQTAKLKATVDEILADSRETIKKIRKSNRFKPTLPVM